MVQSVLHREPDGASAAAVRGSIHRGEEQAGHLRLAVRDLPVTSSTRKRGRCGGEGQGGVLGQLAASMGSRQVLGPGGPDHGVQAAAVWGCSGDRKGRKVGSEQVRLVPVDYVSEVFSTGCDQFCL